VGTTQTWNLLERWRAGDRDALAALLERDMEWIRRRVHQQLGPGLRKAGDTDDFVQEAAIAVLDDGPRFVVSSQAQFRALLAKIVLNIMRGEHRKLHALKRGGGAEQTLPNDSVLDLDAARRAPTQPDEAAVHAEQKEWLRLALLLLDPADQQVMDLHWQGLSDADIGARLEIAMNTARMRRTRAQAKLVSVVRKLKTGQIDEVVGGV